MTSLFNPAKKADVMLGKLVSYNGVTVAGDKDFDGKTGEIKDLSLLLLDNSKAHDIMKWLVSSQVAYTVSNIETRKINRSPPPPFITSTLQQEASKKLGLSPSRTMSIAQELYEQGYITYMRTDSPYLSTSAVNMAKSYVLNNKGSTYLADDTKPKSAKSAPPKNAQEAHEAIRPADSNGRFRTPQDTGLDGQQLSLYTLIYKRTVASVMAASISETKTYTIQASGDGNQALIRSSATSILFDGYLNIYGVEAMTPQDTASALKVKDPLLLSPKFTRDNSRDDSEEEATDGEENSEKVVMKGVQGMAHTTRAPSRFTEASFIKELDDIGVGRPSTYSKILNILKERGYIMVDKQTIIPTLTGMVVSSFLEKHFNDLVEPQFTASMEDSLDAIAHGTKDKLDILTHFYLNDNPSTKSGLLYRVQNKIQNQLIDQKSSRILDIPFLKDVGRIQINRSGAYVESVDATESGDDAKQYRWKLSDEMNNDIRVITEDSIKELMATRSSMQGNSLGTHPSSNKQMVIRSGRYGTYLQVGEDADKDKSTHSLPDWLDAASCTIHDALQFASLPLTIGNHPDLNEPIVVEVGSRKLCVSMPTYSARYPLPDHTYISDVTVEVALQYLPSTEEIMRSQRLLGEDKNCSDAKVWLKLGRFGYYVRRENTIAGTHCHSPTYSLTYLLTHSRRNRRSSREEVEQGTVRHNHGRRDLAAEYGRKADGEEDGEGEESGYQESKSRSRWS
jgi:DNA topoisomerase-1